MEKTSGCEHKCTNAIGSFICSCYDGYELNSDDKTCTQKGKFSIFLKGTAFMLAYVIIFSHYLWVFTKRKDKFLYSAVSSPQNRSKHFTLCFSDRPVHSDTISASLGSNQPYATINVRRLLVHISTIVYN